VIDDPLRNALDAITEPYTEYVSPWEEIQDSYQDEYPAHKWIGALVLDLPGLTPDTSTQV
jgi:hypothetical protein